MKTILLTITIILGLTSLKPQQQNFSLSLEFEITKHNEGQILFAMYNSEKNHMENEYKTAEVKVVDQRAKIEITGLSKGEYSFSYFHDVNNNGELDTNFVGVPKEPYGFSNGEKGRLGPPDFEDSKILIDKDIKLNISVK